MKKIRTLLLKEKELLMNELQEQIHQTVELEHSTGDEIDYSVEEQEREFIHLLQDRERDRLILINDALERIEAGDYGFCEECGEAISKKRLYAFPLARLCIACQQEAERVYGKVKLHREETAFELRN